MKNVFLTSVGNITAPVRDSAKTLSIICTLNCMLWIAKVLYQYENTGFTENILTLISIEYKLCKFHECIS